MAINKKLIHFKNKQKFNEELANGNILETSIVFIQDSKEIYTHGQLYDGSKVDLSKLEEAISKIKTDGDGLMYLNDKGEYKIPQIIVDSEEELNSITPEIGTRAVVRSIVEGYDNLNLAKIITEEETNVPADMFDALDKYAFKVTSVDTSIQFPYQEDDEHTVYELFTLQNGFEKFKMVINQDGSSISRVHIDSFGNLLHIYNGYGQEFYWHDYIILERIITADNIMSITNLGQNVINAFLLFSTALNVSIIANKEYTGYYYTSKGWVQDGYITEQQLQMSIFELLNFITDQIPTRVSQLVNDANYIQDDIISNGVYAVDASGKLIDYTTADSTALGVALVAGEHKFMIAKKDASNDGSNYNLYYDYDKGDLSLTNYNTADGTNRNGYLGTKLSDDFTTWTEGALSDFNGKTNTQVIAASTSNAKNMCKDLETFNAGSDNQGHSDWYIPACGQLALMYLAKTDINAALANIGGTAFESNYYWSSSEFDARNAWRVFFGNGGVYSSFKTNDNRVRFIRDIPVPKPLKERVSDLESSKQDALISGTNIKTINGESILGSGNIEISGGSSSGGSGAYAEINHGTNDTTFTLTPNTFHVWDEVASLDLSFADGQAGIANEYLFQFTSGATATTLTLPDVKWAEELVVASNAVYQVSVLKGLGVWVEF